MGNKSKMPQIGEAVFCIIYLIYGYVAGIVMVSHVNGIRLNLILGYLLLSGFYIHLMIKELITMHSFS